MSQANSRAAASLALADGSPGSDTPPHAPSPSAEARRGRLRLADLRHEASPDGRCRISVHLEWKEEILDAESEGIETQQGRILACARATLDAALAASTGVRLDLVGVKAIRAFDGWVVVGRVDGEADGQRYRLLGSAACAGEDELLLTAARAVLDATNRVLERYVGAG